MSVNGFRFLPLMVEGTVPLALRRCSATASAVVVIALAPLPLFTTNFGSRTRLVYAVLNFYFLFLHFFDFFFMYYSLYILNFILFSIYYILNLYVFYVL